MSVQVEKLEKNTVKLTIEVPAEELEKALQEAYNRQKKNISMPGFRKGKVPRAMVEKMYGVGVFYEDAANALIPQSYADAAKQCGEDIVSRPVVDITQIEKGKPFIFTAEVATKPEVTLGKYIGVTVTKVDGTVTDEDVTAAIDKEREKNARTINVEDRAIENGDTAVIDFEGFVDGVAFDGGKGENHSLEIGSGSFIPGFEDQLIGKNAGDDVDVNVTFPEEYHAENLQGKDAVFKCTVHEIKEKELPAIDDEFAAEVSEFDTLDEYKADVKAKIKEEKAKEGKAKKEDQVIAKAIENATMEIPELMIKTQARQQMDNFAQNLMSQGLTMEQYAQFTGMTADKMMEQMLPSAEKNIKTRLVLEAIAKAENIEISDEKIDEKLAEMAKSYDMEVEKLKELVGEAEKQQMKDDMAVQEAIDFLVENAVEK